MSDAPESLDAGLAVLLSDLESDELLPAIIRRVSENSLTVVPVSPEVRFATEWDLVLSPSTLGYAAVAQVWNFGSALPEQVIDVVGALDADEREAMDALAQLARGGGAVPDHLPVGPPVLDDNDPRLLWQEADAERTRAFWSPALALAGAETLGQLVSHRRHELGIGTAELEPLSHVPGWLDALEHDALDVRGSLQPTALARLMQRLHLVASRKLASIAFWTIEGQQPARARKGTAEADDVASTEDYVEAMLRELKEFDE